MQQAKNQDLAAQLFGNVDTAASPLTAHGRRVGRYSHERHAPYHHNVPDGCAVFVGNLPPEASKQQLEIMFQKFGRVASVDIIQKPSPSNNRLNTFAFIGFATPEEAAAPVGQDLRIGQWKIRVEAKEYNMRRRGSSFQDSSPYMDTMTASTSEDQILAHLSNEALSLGLSRDKAARIMAINKQYGVHIDTAPMPVPYNPRYPVVPASQSLSSPMATMFSPQHAMMPSPMSMQPHQHHQHHQHPHHHASTMAMSPTPASSGGMGVHGQQFYQPHPAYPQYAAQPYEMCATMPNLQLAETIYNGHNGGGAVELSTIHEEQQQHGNDGMGA